MWFEGVSIRPWRQIKPQDVSSEDAWFCAKKSLGQIEANIVFWGRKQTLAFFLSTKSNVCRKVVASPTPRSRFIFAFSIFSCRKFVERSNCALKYVVGGELGCLFFAIVFDTYRGGYLYKFKHPPKSMCEGAYALTYIYKGILTFIIYIIGVEVEKSKTGGKLNSTVSCTWIRQLVENSFFC